MDEGLDPNIEMDQAVGCWSINEKDKCNAEKTLTNDKVRE